MRDLISGGPGGSRTPCPQPPTATSLCLCQSLLARRKADRSKWPGSTLPPPICILSAAPPSCPLLSSTPALSRSSPAWPAASLSPPAPRPPSMMQLEAFPYRGRVPGYPPWVLLPSIKAEDCLATTIMPTLRPRPLSSSLSSLASPSSLHLALQHTLSTISSLLLLLTTPETMPVWHTLGLKHRAWEEGPYSPAHAPGAPHIQKQLCLSRRAKEIPGDWQ